MHVDDTGSTAPVLQAQNLPCIRLEGQGRPRLQELERLERAGVIEPVHFSEWAAPIVPVLKRDGSVRVCGDYKVTVNRAAKLDTYPLPRIDDLFASLAGGITFTKLDLAHAYQQILLDEGSKKL